MSKNLATTRQKRDLLIKKDVKPYTVKYFVVKCASSFHIPLLRSSKLHPSSLIPLPHYGLLPSLNFQIQQQRIHISRIHSPCAGGLPHR